MKKKIYILLLTPIIYLASCSKSGVTPQIESNIEETIVGKTWKLLDSNAGYFYLNADYTYLTKDVLCDSLNEEGTWELEENILIFRHIDGPIEYVERNTIIEFNDSIVKVLVDTSSNLDMNLIFETTEDVIRGCMDSTATNFNADAVCSLECIYSGCTDEFALNYNPFATIDDGSCCYIAGCTDEAADNYNPNACIDDGSCTYTYGCTDANALNYNPNALFDDGSCCYVAGCMDNSALNYNANACQDDGSCCYVGGCTDVSAPNFNPSACFDDGSCIGIGDAYQGGVIFFLDGMGGGLIMATSDQATNIEWGCNGILIGGLSTAVGSGYQNTLNIVAGCNLTNTPAYICANLNLGGYNDWFLPSLDELVLALSSAHPNLNISGNLNDRYWTSSQHYTNPETHVFSVSNEFAYYFSTSKLNNGGFGYTMRVRAIRSF